MINFLLNLIHLLLLLIPFVMFLFNPTNSILGRIIKKYDKFILLVIVLVPLHWVFIDDQCFLTALTKNTGDFKESETTSPFSEKYLQWLYKPIMDTFKWEWNSKGLDKMLTLHSIFNILLVWYYVFYF